MLTPAGLLSRRPSARSKMQVGRGGRGAGRDGQRRLTCGVFSAACTARPRRRRSGLAACGHVRQRTLAAQFFRARECRELCVGSGSRHAYIGCRVPLETAAHDTQRGLSCERRAASLAQGNPKSRKRSSGGEARRSHARPSLTEQIDDDEAWLAANDDDDWDAPAEPPAPAAARAGARRRGSAGAGRGAATGEHDDGGAAHGRHDARRGPGLRL